MTLLRAPAEARLDAAALDPIEVLNPELLAPLARSIHNGKCPACQAPVHGVLDQGPDGAARVQITCFGPKTHAFFFDARTGHIDNQPTAMGQVRD